MSAPRWLVLVDILGNGSFVDLSAYVAGISGQTGFQDVAPKTFIASVGQMGITLNNLDKRFSPAYKSGPYYGNLVPDRAVQIYCQTQYFPTPAYQQIWTGYVDKWTPDPGDKGQRQCKLTCIDLLGKMQFTNVQYPEQTSVTADKVIKDLVNYTLNAPYASQTVTFAKSAPAASDTITIDGQTLTYVSSSPGQNQLLTGTSVQAATSLYEALNSLENLGTDYGAIASMPRVTALYNGVQNYFNLVKGGGPLRYYRMDESSGTALADSSGNSFNGTFNGTVGYSAAGAIQSDPDTAITFDGSTTWCNIGTTKVVTEIQNSSFSLECWFAPSNFTQNSYLFGILIDTLGAGRGVDFYFQINGGHTGGGLAADFFGSSNSVATSQDVTTTLNVYIHCVFTFDWPSKTATLYANGVQVAQATGLTGVTVTPTGSYLGILNGAFGPTAGKIDEAAIYTYCLSAAQVQAHYFSGANAPIVTLQSLLPGAAYNSIAVSKSSTNITLGGATLAGGVDYPTVGQVYDTGVQTFPNVGHTWNAQTKKTSIYSAIEELTRSEYGKFWTKGNGAPVFRNARWYFSHLVDPVMMTISNDGPLAAGDIDPGRIINDITITVVPVAQVTMTPIAKSNGTIIVPAQGTKTVRLPFVDPTTSQPVGMSSLTLPIVAGTDWTATDGNGVSYTSSGLLKFTYSVKSTGIDITIKNSSYATLQVTALQVRGIGIVTYNPTIYPTSDATSASKYQYHSDHIDLTLSNDANYADSLAHYILDKFKNPIFRLKTLTWPKIVQSADGKQFLMGGQVLNSGQAQNLIRLNVGDLVRVSDSQSGVQNELYQILNLKYAWTLESLQVTAIVERMDDQTYWLLGDPVYGQLGVTTRLAI